MKPCGTRVSHSRLTPRPPPPYLPATIRWTGGMAGSAGDVRDRAWTSLLPGEGRRSEASSRRRTANFARSADRQAAGSVSAACHMTQTTPPHEASDSRSLIQRAMTVLPVACSGYVLCSCCVLVKSARPADERCRVAATSSMSPFRRPASRGERHGQGSDAQQQGSPQTEGRNGPDG